MADTGFAAGAELWGRYSVQNIRVVLIREAHCIPMAGITSGSPVEVSIRLPIRMLQSPEVLPRGTLRQLMEGGDDVRSDS